MHPIFTPWCAGTSQKNVGLGLVPRQGRGARHRRHLTLPSTNAPNFHTLVCRHQPEKCRAGACPPPGAGCVAQTTPDPPTNPMHPIFIPWCAGTSQKNVGLRLVPRQGRGAWHGRHLTLPSTNAPNFHTLVCRHQPASAIATNMGCNGSRACRRRLASIEKCRAGACPPPGAGCVAQTTPDPPINNQCTQFSYLGVPAPAGISNCYESMSRTPIRDRPLRLPSPFAASLRQSGPPIVIPAKAGIQRGGAGRGNDANLSHQPMHPIFTPRRAGNDPPRKGAKAARNRKKPPVLQKEEVLTQLKCPSSLAIAVPWHRTKSSPIA